MNITKVVVHRKFNLGNYESLDLGAEAELNEKDNPLESWVILRDNIEMCFTDMQRKKTTTPAASPFKKTEPKQQDFTVCPKCGGKKKPDFKLCYNCHEAEKAGAD